MAQWHPFVASSVDRIDNVKALVGSAVDLEATSKTQQTLEPVCRIYRVYDLRSYELLYSLADKSVAEVKISPGIMLVIHNATTSVPLKILNIEDGTVLKVSC